MRTYGMVPSALFALLRMGDAWAKTEPAEITIYLRGEHKGVVSALLEAVDEGAPIQTASDAGQPLSAPSWMPRTKNRWPKTKSTIIGSIISTLPVIKSE